MVTLLGLSVAVILVIFAFYSIFGLMGTTFAVGNHKEWRELIANPPDYGLESTKVNFASEDGTPIAAWWLSSKRTNREKGTIILIHGSGGNRSSMLSRASFLVKNGYKVLAVDLRAHGESGGNYMGLGYLEAKDVIAGAEPSRRGARTAAGRCTCSAGPTRGRRPRPGSVRRSRRSRRA